MSAPLLPGQEYRLAFSHESYGIARGGRRFQRWYGKARFPSSVRALEFHGWHDATRVLSLKIAQSEQLVAEVPPLLLTNPEVPRMLPRLMPGQRITLDVLGPIDWLGVTFRVERTR